MPQVDRDFVTLNRILRNCVWRLSPPVSWDEGCKVGPHYEDFHLGR